MNFRKDINGLRAIAVIAVVFFHFDVFFFPGGFAGVDVFFVISGYLMTKIIISSIDSNNFSLINFYTSRSNRIIPPLVFLCLILFVFGIIFIPQDEFLSLIKHIISSVTFVSNMVFWMESGYFDVASKEKWLLHTWSLSVEWQFYIIYPLFLLLLKKTFSNSIVNRILVLTTVGLFLFSVIATDRFMNAGYFLLPTRAWEMLIGSIIFVYPIKLDDLKSKLLEFFGLFLIISSYLVLNDGVLWPSPLTLIPVLGTCFVLISNRTTSVFTNNKILQSLGSASYSIYLWHWPVVVYINYFGIREFTYIFLLFSILLGFIAYTLVEKRSFKSISSIKDCFGHAPFWLTLCTILICIVFSNHSIWIYRQDKLTQMTYTSYSNRLVEHDVLRGDSECHFKFESVGEFSNSEFSLCKEKYGKGIVILGDSHAIDLFNATTMTKGNYLPFVLGVVSGGCRINQESGNCSYNDFKKYIENHNYFKHVIFEQAAFYLFIDEKGRRIDRSYFDELPEPDGIVELKSNISDIDKIYDYLSELSKSIKVTWFGSRIEPHFSKKYIYENSCNGTFELRRNQLDAYINLDYDMMSVVRSVHNKNLRFISQNSMLNYDFSNDFMTCNKTYWSDGDHWSSSGEKYFGNKINLELFRFD